MLGFVDRIGADRWGPGNSMLRATSVCVFLKTDINRLAHWEWVFHSSGVIWEVNVLDRQNSSRNLWGGVQVMIGTEYFIFDP